MTTAVKLVTAPESAQTRVVAALESLLERAKTGGITGFVVLFEDKQAYHTQRINLSLEVSLGLLTRTTYTFNQEWDKS